MALFERTAGLRLRGYDNVQAFTLLTLALKKNPGIEGYSSEQNYAEHLNQETLARTAIDPRIPLNHQILLIETWAKDNQSDGQATGQLWHMANGEIHLIDNSIWQGEQHLVAILQSNFPDVPFLGAEYDRALTFMHALGYTRRIKVYFDDEVK
jgi:hypothetical protein